MSEEKEKVISFDNEPIILENDDIRSFCYGCSNLTEKDWYKAPHIEVTYKECTAGGCRKLAESYKEQKNNNMFQLKIIKKHLG